MCTIALFGAHGVGRRSIGSRLANFIVSSKEQPFGKGRLD
jgi:hypothetical protein